ncbi:MAG: alpha-L-arabinofuranosidase [Chloroflexaceae bacterium]|jgi:alpha-L-arabinofuranosidase|nr:alpha-L-arabinofuranosidase [Chloroflexaceae bacterium]
MAVRSFRCGRVALLFAVCFIVAGCTGLTDRFTQPPSLLGAPTAASQLAESTAGTISINAAGPSRMVDARLLGTNVPAWLNPTRLTNATFLAHTAASGATVLRLPGGSWSNSYNWLACERDRVDPCDWAARPSDFVTFLRTSGREGMWTINFNGTAKEAAALVAFFNGVVTDERPIGVDQRGRDWQTVGYWARLRRDNGNPEPVNIRLWEVGNEIYGGKKGTGKDCADWGWEDGWTCDGTEYVQGQGEGSERREGFLEFRNAMRAVDPNIQVGAVGIPTQREWNNWGNEVIAAAGQEMDFYVIHQYAFFERPDSPEQILAEPQRTWAAMMADVQAAFAQHANGRQIPIAVTEYNLFSFQENDTEALMSRAINLLHLADTIGQLATHGFSMANQWNMANGVPVGFGNYGLLDSETFARNPQYYAFPLWANFGRELLPVTSSFAADTELSVYAGRSDGQTLTLLAINKTNRPLRASIGVEEVEALVGGTADVAQADSLDDTQVRFNGSTNPNPSLNEPTGSTLQPNGTSVTYTFAPYSVTLLRLTVKP